MITQICLCGGQAGYPASHTYDCPRPLYTHNPQDSRIEQWEREREEKGRRLRGEAKPSLA